MGPQRGFVRRRREVGGPEEASGGFLGPMLLRRTEDGEPKVAEFPPMTALDMCPQGLPAV